jgi:hypothetical protein
MAKEAKALFSKCPNCETVTARPVESYRTAMKPGSVRSFTCANCKTEYFVSNEQVSCGVVEQATPQIHPLRITA